MNINQLESFKLSDAVKFHDKLNPKLFVNNKPRPEVKKQLILIAKDFITELGIKDLDVADITISGSNAAYTYTPHSDLDLHILVDFNKLSNDEVYRELFNAKKTIYNDSHDIKVHGVPVELYVQDSNEPVISLGEYSLLQNKWLRIPVKRRANLDQTITKQKFKKLYDLVQIALKSKNIKKVEELLKTMRRYRQVGLDKGGEFSPENLAYKALRSQGWLTKLYDLRDKLHSKSLSIEAMYEQSILNVPTLTPQQLTKRHNVSVEHIMAELKKGIKVEQEHTKDIKVAKEIALDHLKEDPNYYTKLLKANLEETFLNEGLSPIVYHYTTAVTAKNILSTGEFQLSSTLGSVEEQYAPKGYPYFLSTTRSRRGGYHETIGDDAVLFVLDGKWYSSHYKAAPVDYWSNRDPQKSHHRTHEAEDRIFSKDPTMSIKGVTEIHIYVSPEAESRTKAWARQDLILAKRLGISTYFYTDKNAWRNQDTRKLGDVSILTGQERTGGYISTHKGYLLPWIELVKSNNQNLLSDKANKLRYSLIYQDYYKNDAAKGLANDLSNARKPNSGPDREHAINIIRYMQANKLNNVSDLVNNLANKWKSLTKVDESASGYIPSNAEKNDPRFKTALTVDVKPNTIKKNAKAFGFKVSRAGIPPLLRK
jgi:hypothetical protein